ncbi:hypothetical protein ITJ64_11645 [Herbiconiux sp. VKM Ac-1786]|uniref:hypothetical protein n=1 Tax=Herbiconiux sp. VKM Ac-1786 TaxID=2783824 RepID=UPI00188B653F|nr:hypothetical protein [Herbiconiux sp. VKM Ac-1786]MBF4573173.1 hypothetical protein [Herbiconiux sp. VKM Ac-1786]
MKEISAVISRYQTTSDVIGGAVEIFAVGDPASARLNIAVQGVHQAIRDDGAGLWDDVLGASRLLRWRLVTQPLPVEINLALRDGVESLLAEVRKIRNAVGRDGGRLLDAIEIAAVSTLEEDPAAGEILQTSVDEVGANDCVIVVAGAAAAAAFSRWIGPSGVAIETASGFTSSIATREQAYVVGPPRYFVPSVVTSPSSRAVCYITPAWFKDRSIPVSAVSAHAENPIQVRVRTFEIGNVLLRSEALNAEFDELEPQPNWGDPEPGRVPAMSEVLARRVVLSGSFEVFLDDGDRIRSLSPQQPVGERVAYTDVNAVRPGSYLLLREGKTERQAMYDEAISLLGADGAAAEESQRNWKAALQSRMDRIGVAEASAELSKLGVTRSSRCGVWVEQTVVRPQSDHDFAVLLDWLGSPVESTIAIASTIRKLRSQVSVNVRLNLEKAAADADLGELESNGHLSLVNRQLGFRGIIATRVLHVSPRREVIPRSDARVLRTSGGVKWLE